VLSNIGKDETDAKRNPRDESDPGDRTLLGELSLLPGDVGSDAEDQKARHTGYPAKSSAAPNEFFISRDLHWSFRSFFREMT
jgi:hypothetical protein